MTPRHPEQMPCLLFANSKGEIQEFPELWMAGRSGYHYAKPALTDLIPLPEGSELFVLPGRLPIGIDPADGQPARLADNPYDSVDGIQAVAAFVAPAHTTIQTAAFEKKDPSIQPLPLFAYTAVGWHNNQFWVASFRSDLSIRQDASKFDTNKIKTRTLAALKRNPENRLIQHLGKCSLTYSCPAAKNFFQGREEAPLPTSPACNAACLGCISLQPSGCCPSTQDRIKFVPTPAEITEVALSHLNAVDHAVVSFGQGCEGEPLLQAETIERAIRSIRRQTSRGTINLNTNASIPEAVASLAEAGLDSIRVSINSARPHVHSLYYRPKGFNFDDVRQSIVEMKKRGRFVSLNYFICPGVTDSADETEAFCHLIENYRPDFVQLRNLNMDPDWYLEAIHHPKESETCGITPWLTTIRNRFPELRFGYFNPPLR
ncbi:MAG: radical SAM protein [Proteobacteria bacterium]|nr:radical SAM protein [Desulfobulbaceae bacterium]MBU4154305.1 radical SAM protein [Pseudomonadota bacterium]